jgi:hypothetical protein
MQIGNYNIKPILLYLPDDEFWEKEWREAQTYLASQGINDFYEIAGIHYNWGVAGRHIYLADNRPEEQFYIGDKKVAGNLSQYLCFSVMNAMNETHFMFMEGDARFVDDWREKLEQALNDVPEDFDFLYVGSCCAKDKEPVHIAGNVYHFPYRGEEKKFFYPQCSHAMIIAKKCIPYLIETNRDVANPADVSLIINSFPNLNVYAILPRISDQGTKTELPE